MQIVPRLLENIYSRRTHQPLYDVTGNTKKLHRNAPNRLIRLRKHLFDPLGSICEHFFCLRIHPLDLPVRFRKHLFCLRIHPLDLPVSLCEHFFCLRIHLLDLLLSFLQLLGVLSYSPIGFLELFIKFPTTPRLLDS